MASTETTSTRLAVEAFFVCSNEGRVSSRGQIQLPVVLLVLRLAVQLGPLRVLGAVLLLGVVSLFADMTYEGARSITGPYLAVLGASAPVVGIVAGFGELIGYGLRLVSGYLSDRTGRYWAITLVGYAVNMLAVPLLALA